MISSELLDYVRFLGFQIGLYPNTYGPPTNSRSLVYTSLELYRQTYVSQVQSEEFYTIVVAALQDGEEAGRNKLEQAKQFLIEENRKEGSGDNSSSRSVDSI